MPSSRLSKVNTHPPSLDLNSSHLNVEDLLQQPVEVLLKYLRGKGIETTGLIEKEQLAQRVLDFNRTQISRTSANQDDLSVSSPSWVPADDCSVTLDQIPSLHDVELLSNGQLREILSVHSVDHHALVERDEYISQVRQLWLDRKEKRTFCPGNSESGKRCQQEQLGVPGNECCVCREGNVDCAILNCGHVCCCERCAKRLSSCPVCRQSINRIIRLYPV